MLLDEKIPGGSDDDSILYCDRNLGEGVPPEDHNESDWDIDF